MRRKRTVGPLPDFIIFGSGNYNSLGVLHCMAAAGVEVFLLLVGSGKEAMKGEVIRYSRYARHWHCVSGEQEGIEWLLGHGTEFPRGTVIYPTADTVETLLDLHFNDLSNYFHFPNAGREGAVTRLMEKDRQTALAEDAGIRTLWSLYTTHPDFSRDRVRYPCMVKPLMSVTGEKGDMRVCSNRKELDDALDNARHTRDFIVQQYIENESDLLFLGICFADGQVWIPAVVRKPGVSKTGEYTHAIITSDVAAYLPEMDAVTHFINQLGYVGPFSIEFGVERGKNYFFEINLRNDGTTHYPLNGGINIPYTYYIYNRGEKTKPDVTAFEYDMVDEWFDLRSVLSREQRLVQWLKRMRRARAHRWYIAEDPLPSLMMAPLFVTRFFQKLCRMARRK